MELRSIDVIKPLIKEPPPNILMLTLYYPYMVFHIKVTIRRVWGEPSHFHGFVTIDMARSLVFLSDSMPSTFQAEVPVNLIIPDRISEEKALSLAKKKMVYVAMRKYKIVLPPKVEVVESKKVYKQFWLVRIKDRKYIVDSLTGESEEYMD